MMQGVPVDPRVESGLPKLGSLAKVETFDGDITRVIAPNPSPMTLDGTNTYVVMDLQQNAALIVDPGPTDESHFCSVKLAMDSLQVEPVGIVLTHHHLDHSETAAEWASRWKIGVSAQSADLVAGGGNVLVDNEVVRVGKRRLKVLCTPGHASDHISLQSDDGYLLSGDHILGRSTSVVTHPDGSIEAYLNSLIKVRNIGSRTILPGHGPIISKELSTSVIEYYISHRKFRLSQIEGLLKTNTSLRVAELTRLIYGDDLVENLFEPATQVTRAALVFLMAAGVVFEDNNNGGFRLVE